MALRRRARARGCARERFDLVIDFHGGPRSGLLTWATRRAAAHRLRPARPALVLHDARALDAIARAAAAFGPESVGAARAARHRAARSRARSGDDAARSGGGAPRRRTARAPPASIAIAPLIVLHVSAGNPFRRWPARIVCGSGRRAGVRQIRRAASSSRPGHRRAPPRKPWPTRRDGSPAARPSRIVRTGEFDLAELRALVDRAALYIGGDSGPLHIAATTRTPIVALFGPTLPERSMPWRDPAIGAHRRRRRPAALPALSPASLRARRLSLPDRDFAYDGGRQPPSRLLADR